MSTPMPVHGDPSKGSWLAFVALGIILLILGMVALGHATMATLVSVEFYGFLMIGGGILQAVHGLWRRQWSGFLIEILAGMLYLAVGILFVTDPLASAQIVTLLIALALMVGGLFRICAAISGQFAHWLWILLHGVVSLLLGISIWRQWPLSGLWVIGLFLGIDLLLNGWTLLFLGLRLRSVAKQASGS